MERAFQLGKAVKKPGKALKKRYLQGPEGPARKKKEAEQCRNIKEKLFLGPTHRHAKQGAAKA